MPVPEGDFPDAVILAAIRRAELHSRHRDGPGTTYSQVVDHLGLRMGSATGHKLRPRFRAMEAAGLIAPAKRHSLIFYAATRKGQRVLKAAGEVELPESPQHREWREAHTAAAERIQGFHDDLRVLLREGRTLLADDAPDSAAWYAFGKRVARACSRLGSATYCLREWAEPSDDTRDHDGPDRGSRNTRAWDCPYG